jgi:hypothetical protein
MQCRERDKQQITNLKSQTKSSEQFPMPICRVPLTYLVIGAWSLVIA